MLFSLPLARRTIGALTIVVATSLPACGEDDSAAKVPDTTLLTELTEDEARTLCKEIADREFVPSLQEACTVQAYWTASGEAAVCESARKACIENGGLGEDDEDSFEATLCNDEDNMLLRIGDNCEDATVADVRACKDAFDTYHRAHYGDADCSVSADEWEADDLYSAAIEACRAVPAACNGR